MVAQAGLDQCWSQTLYVGFVVMWLKSRKIISSVMTKKLQWSAFNKYVTRTND
jgi:hypothetical protein